MPDPLVVQVMAAFKRGLRAREAESMREMAREWRRIEVSLEEEVERLARELQQRRLAGEVLTQGSLARLERVQRLLSQARLAAREFAIGSANRTASAQLFYARLGIQQAATATGVLTTGSVPTNVIRLGFSVLPVEAVEAIVGLGGDGSPLLQLFNRSWPETATRMMNTLTRSTAQGINPRRTARLLQDAMSNELHRAMVIARTEQLRAYRYASREQYLHSGVVAGFQRLATRDDRVCPACLMADGEIYEVDEWLREHPQGRCTTVPITGQPHQWLYGKDWFQQQDQATQIRILGPGRHDAWQNGQFDLDQLVSVKRNQTWGDAVYPTPLKDLVA